MYSRLNSSETFLLRGGNNAGFFLKKGVLAGDLHSSEGYGAGGVTGNFSTILRVNNIFKPNKYQS